MFNLLMYLKEDVIVIQDKFSIISYFNQERVEEVDEKVRAYLQKFEEFYNPLEDNPGVILSKYSEIVIKKIWIIKERLLPFLNLTP